MRTVQNRIARTSLLATILSVAFATQALAAASKDEDAIKARVADFVAAFNKGDGKTMAAFWIEDGTLINPMGVSGKGPAEIEKVIATDAAFFKGAKMEMKVVQYRSMGKDAAWIEIEHSVTGAMTPDGKPMPPMTFHVPAVLLKKGKTWMIADARPYAYLPPPPAAKPAMAAPAAPAKK